MSPDDFDFVARIMRERAGLVLTRDKGYLVENRLLPLVRTSHLKSLDELIAALRQSEPDLQLAAVDAMLAKDTGFFRDWKPFEHFRAIVLPNIAAYRSTKKTFRILSAAASTGQEAYSIAMTVKENEARFPGWRYEIMGVDLSPSALAVAKNAVYSQFDVQRGLPIRKLLQYFVKENENWRLQPGVSSLVKFQPWNLLADMYPLGKFDVVMCRNVLVYFDQQTKFDVLQKLSRLLTDDGVLYLGADEPVMGVAGGFKPVPQVLGAYAVVRPEKPLSFSLALPR